MDSQERANGVCSREDSMCYCRCSCCNDFSPSYFSHKYVNRCGGPFIFDTSHVEIFAKMYAHAETPITDILILWLQTRKCKSAQDCGSSGLTCWGNIIRWSVARRRCSTNIARTQVVSRQLKTRPYHVKASLIHSRCYLICLVSIVEGVFPSFGVDVRKLNWCKYSQIKDQVP